jgi:hypothetical protein
MSFGFFKSKPYPEQEDLDKCLADTTTSSECDMVAFNWLVYFINELYKLKKVIIDGKHYPINLIDINNGINSETNTRLNRAFFIRIRNEDDNETREIVNKDDMIKHINRKDILETKLSNSEYVKLNMLIETYDLDQELTNEMKTNMIRKQELEEQLKKSNNKDLLEYVKLAKLIRRNREMHRMIEYILEHKIPLKVMLNFPVSSEKNFPVSSEKKSHLKTTIPVFSKISFKPDLLVLHKTNWQYIDDQGKINKGLQAEFLYPTSNEKYNVQS